MVSHGELDLVLHLDDGGNLDRLHLFVARHPVIVGKEIDSGGRSHRAQRKSSPHKGTLVPLPPKVGPAKQVGRPFIPLGLHVSPALEMLPKIPDRHPGKGAGRQFRHEDEAILKKNDLSG